MAASAEGRLSLDGMCAGPRVKSAQRAMGRMRARPKVDEARDILANVVVCHVPVIHYNFQQKVQLPINAFCAVDALMTTWKPGRDSSCH